MSRRVKSAMLVEKAAASSSGPALLVLLLALLFSGQLCAAIHLTPAQAQAIGRRIWQNECGGTVPGLTSWNEGENFASLGIGHFIWSPKGQRGPFEESFPELINFMRARGAKLPPLLVGGHGAACPWNSRAAFLAAQDSPEMKQLRRFLADTVDLQAQFLVARLQNALPKMMAQSADAARVQRQFERVGATAQGCYALVDYVNFKGEGTLATERYHGEGWGLLQVLETMNDSTSQSALDEFVASAKTVLRRRVANSPPERAESRWLRGWLARVESYRAR